MQAKTQSNVVLSRCGLSPFQAHSAWLDSKIAINSKRISFLICPSLVQKQTLSLGRQDPAASPLIAIVDDEPAIAVTLAEIFERRGFDTVWFTNSTDALDFVRSCAAVTLLLSDINMPVLDGISLAQDVLKSRVNCAVVLISASGNEGAVAQRIRGLNLQIHLETKPVQIDKLLSRVEMLLKTCIPAGSLTDRSKTGRSVVH